jgi:Kdo2-lipid IVA lauroyltransferase/acyltransferase
MINQHKNTGSGFTKRKAAAVVQDERYHEGFIKRILNRLVVFLLYLISLLPFRILYLLSDFLYLMMRFVFRYRSKTIADNLLHAFPEKTPKQRSQIAKAFYRHFADLMFEVIKLHSISAKQMEKRIKFEGIEKINSLLSGGKSIIILAMHHNNWEWCSFMQTRTHCTGFMVYNPIRGNQAMEEFMLHSREKWGGKCIPVHQSARITLEFHQKNIPTGIWLGADQTPPSTSKFWTVFLNREAPFFTGPEKIAAKTNQPVFFQHVSKTGRGRYLARFIPLIENPSAVPSKDILLSYVRKMEEIIRQEPEFYLWSHRRWKHRRPDDIPLTM